MRSMVEGRPPGRGPSTALRAVPLPSKARGGPEEGPLMTAHDPIVILSYARTPMGSFQGALAGASATELGAAAVARRGRARRRRRTTRSSKIYMGCVLPAGLGQAPARQAALKAGPAAPMSRRPRSTRCAARACRPRSWPPTRSHAGSADIVVAGGMESMTNAPYLLPKHRGGARIGHDTIVDHMFFDGLEDAYEQGRLMGSFAEETRARLSVHPRGAGRLRHRLADPRPAGAEQRRLRPRDRRGRDRRPQGPDRRSTRTSSPPRATPSKIPTPEARLRQGRHDHRRQRLVDLATAPPPWSSPARASPTGSASSPSPASSATPPTPTSPPSSPPPRSAR